MAKSFDEVVAAAAQLEDQGRDARVTVSIATLQPGNVCMYASGALDYKPGGRVKLGVLGSVYRWPSMESDGYTLTSYFSNRSAMLDQPPHPGLGGTFQPFYSKKTSKLRLTIGLRMLSGSLERPTTTLVPPPYASIRFEDTPNSFTVPLQREGDLLVGLGPALEDGTDADHAIYLFAFREFVAARSPND